jgi:hypothetical protein
MRHGLQNWSKFYTIFVSVYPSLRIVSNLQNRLLKWGLPLLYKHISRPSRNRCDILILTLIPKHSPLISADRRCLIETGTKNEYTVKQQYFIKCSVENWSQNRDRLPQSHCYREDFYTAQKIAKVQFSPSQLTT